jgi:hypothetical protein
MRNVLLFARLVSGMIALATLGCAAESGDKPDVEEVGSTDQAVKTFRFTVFPDPYANGTANPADKLRGIANGYIAKNPGAVSGLAEWTVTGLQLAGLPANRTFGAHAHALTCEDNKGGGHYQHVAGSIDPLTSEIWLDFTTDDRGRAQIKVLSPFGVRDGGVQSLVIHSDPTDRATAKAGAKLACANLALKAE